MSFSRSPRPKFQNHLVFITLHNRIFVVFVFDKISKGMLVTIDKELGNIFNDYIFEISGFHWSKCTVECAIYSTLILKSTQARCDVSCSIFISKHLATNLLIQSKEKRSPKGIQSKQIENPKRLIYVHVH